MRRGPQPAAMEIRMDWGDRGRNSAPPHPLTGRQTSPTPTQSRHPRRSHASETVTPPPMTRCSLAAAFACPQQNRSRRCSACLFLHNRGVRVSGEGQSLGLMVRTSIWAVAQELCGTPWWLLPGQPPPFETHTAEDTRRYTDGSFQMAAVVSTGLSCLNDTC